jgi:serine/threonine protein kinase
LLSSLQETAEQVAGTPAYISPEQARGEKTDERTDIYSLGIVVYEMVAGRVPFEAETSVALLLKHVAEPPPPIPGISPELQNAYACLARTELTGLQHLLNSPNISATL